MATTVDLRRFAAPGLRVLLAIEAGEVEVTFAEIAADGACVIAPAGRLTAGARLRGELVEDGLRLAAVFDVVGLRDHVDAGADREVADLVVREAVVLREEPGNPPNARLVHVQAGLPVVRVEARVVAATLDGLTVRCDDRFAPGDRVTLAPTTGDEPRIRLRILRRVPIRQGRALYECQVTMATDEDESWARGLVA